MSIETRPLRILIVVNLPWDPRLGATRVWIELANEWTAAGHLVEKFCLTDAFPTPASSSGVSAIRALLFPARAAAFIRNNGQRFDVIDALVGTLPFSKTSLRFRGLLVARSVGLYRLYEEFEKHAAKRWPRRERGKLIGRIFYRFFNKRIRAAAEASVNHCDLLNLPNSDELVCVREEMRLTRPVMVQPYGLAAELATALAAAAATPERRLHARKVCFLGTWGVRKGSGDWPRIIDHVRATVPEVRFLFLGTMMEPISVLQELNEAHRGSVEVVPKFEPDELPRLLSECTVGAFPSYVEGFGLAVVEQLAAGLPTVAYDAPGPRDIMRDTLPELLTRAGDVDAFSMGIIRILESEEDGYRALAERSLATADRFSWRQIAEATIDEYRRRLPETR